jgi:acetyl esterase/lipase
MDNVQSHLGFVYDSPAGVSVTLDLHIPADGPGPWPVIIGIPGGGWKNAKRNFIPIHYAQHGFAVAAIDYRLVPDHLAPASLHDCKAAVRWVREHAQAFNLNPGRVGLVGSSAGSHLALMTAATHDLPELTAPGTLPLAPVQAVYGVVGPADFTRYASPDQKNNAKGLYPVISDYLGGPVETRPDLARLMSPLTYASRKLPPILLGMVSGDPLVPVEQATVFYNAVKAAGGDIDMFVVEGDYHGWGYKAQDHIALPFLNRALKPG